MQKRPNILPIFPFVLRFICLSFFRNIAFSAPLLPYIFYLSSCSLHPHEHRHGFLPLLFVVLFTYLTSIRCILLFFFIKKHRTYKPRVFTYAVTCRKPRAWGWHRLYPNHYGSVAGSSKGRPTNQFLNNPYYGNDLFIHFCDSHHEITRIQQEEKGTTSKRRN